MMPQPVVLPSYTHEACKNLLILSCFLHKGSVNGIKRKLLHFKTFDVLNKSGGEVLWSQKEAEKKEQSEKQSCVMSLQSFLCYFPLQKHLELPVFLMEVLLEKQFTFAALGNTLPASLYHGPP